MASKELIDNLRTEASKANHTTLPREDFCAIVRESKTDSEGYLKAEAALRDAVEIDVVTVLSCQLVEMLDLLSPKPKKHSEQPSA